MKATTRRRAMIVGAIGLVASGAAWGIGSRGADADVVVRRGDIEARVVAPGTVEAVGGEASLAFDTAGRVTEVLVEEGAHVTAGQVLARLDARLAQARVDEAEASLAAALADRDRAMRGARPGEIRAAEAELAGARAVTEDRVTSRVRVESLAHRAATTTADVDGARHAAEAAQAAEAAAAARVSLLRQGTRAEDRARAVAAAASAAAQVAQARTALSYTDLVAPASGVVVRRFIEVGEQVTTVSPTIAFVVADLGRLQLRTEIDEVDVGRVRVGQAAWATADAWGTRRFLGRVTRLSGTLGRKEIVLDDPRQRFDTRVLEVIVTLDDPAGLPLGLRMDVTLETEVRRGVAVVPLRAVTRTGEATFVRVLGGDGEETRRVRLGIDDGVVAEVASGLQMGERVALIR
jgi:HlyD family secretion protein